MNALQILTVLARRTILPTLRQDLQEEIFGELAEAIEFLTAQHVLFPTLLKFRLLFGVIEDAKERALLAATEAISTTTIISELQMLESTILEQTTLLYGHLVYFYTFSEGETDFRQADFAPTGNVFSSSDILIVKLNTLQGSYYLVGEERFTDKAEEYTRTAFAFDMAKTSVSKPIEEEPNQTLKAEQSRALRPRQSKQRGKAKERTKNTRAHNVTESIVPLEEID